MTEPNRQHKLSVTQKYLIFIGVTLGLCFLLIGLFIFSLWNMHSDREISGELVLSPDWIEITPPKPLSFPKQFQGIVLDVKEPLVGDNLHLERMQLTDGTVVHPELQLIEQGGNVADIKLERGATPSQHDNSVGGYVSRLPEGQVYTRVRVRCDKPLHVSRVIWHSWDGK